MGPFVPPLRIYRAPVRRRSCAHDRDRTEHGPGRRRLAERCYPKRLTTPEVACNACHLAGITHGNAVEKRGLAASPVTASAFVAPQGQDLTVPKGPNHGRNMHAFSWFERRPTITRRVIHESAVVADAMTRF